MTEQAIGWVRLEWREPFFWQRLALGWALTLLPAAACLAFRAGILALLAIAIGSFPWPVRASVSARGVALRWLLVRQAFPAEELVRISLAKDARRWAWPRGMVLSLERRGKRRVLLFAREAALVQLAQAAKLSGLPVASF